MKVINFFFLPLLLAVAKSLFLKLTFKKEKKILQLASGHGYGALHKHCNFFQSGPFCQDVCSLLQGEETVSSGKSLK